MQPVFGRATRDSRYVATVAITQQRAEIGAANTDRCIFWFHLEGIRAAFAEQPRRRAHSPLDQVEQDAVFM